MAIRAGTGEAYAPDTGLSISNARVTRARSNATLVPGVMAQAAQSSLTQVDGRGENESKPGAADPTNGLLRASRTRGMCIPGCASGHL